MHTAVPITKQFWEVKNIKKLRFLILLFFLQCNTAGMYGIERGHGMFRGGGS